MFCGQHEIRSKENFPHVFMKPNLKVGQTQISFFGSLAASYAHHEHLIHYATAPNSSLPMISGYSPRSTCPHSPFNDAWFPLTMRHILAGATFCHQNLFFFIQMFLSFSTFILGNHTFPMNFSVNYFCLHCSSFFDFSERASL